MDHDLPAHSARQRQIQRAAWPIPPGDAYNAAFHSYLWRAPLKGHLIERRQRRVSVQRQVDSATLDHQPRMCEIAAWWRTCGVCGSLVEATLQSQRLIQQKAGDIAIEDIGGVSSILW